MEIYILLDTQNWHVPPQGKVLILNKVLDYCRKENILDNMVLMLERYATNLEEIVEQRTGELMDEKMKTDALLYRLLPLYVI